MNNMFACFNALNFGLCFIVCFALTAVESKTKHSSALERQEHLLRSLPSYEIDYPTQVTHNGRFVRHVTTSARHRSRRSIQNDDGNPVHYSLSFGGKIYQMRLHVNDKLLGSGFVVERHKKGGKIERSSVVENCYLVGEVQGSLHSAAISDCEGLEGIIDIGVDVIYIEPIMNETSYRGTGRNGTGKPHLLYLKSMLNKMDDVNVDLVDDFLPAVSAHAPGRQTAFRYEAASSYINIVNKAERPVNVFYISGAAEVLFSRFGYDEHQNVNTYTSHKWVARDEATNKTLLIGGKEVYSPPANTNNDRLSVHITVPKGLKLPKYEKPAPPDSHLSIVNHAGRFVQLYYIGESKEQKIFATLAPGETQRINTYSGHKWHAFDYDSEKPIWLNGGVVYVAQKSSRADRLTVLVTIPPFLRLPEIDVFPELLDKPPKYIEVMVAADTTVVKHHGKHRVERYILTLMNIVSRIFQHKSIGVKIYFVIVRLMILEEDPKHVKITRSPMDSLLRVCYWGHKMRTGWDKTSKTFYDQTVYLTKKDFGPSGYAPVSSVCTRTRSCTLNDEDGFTSSFIIAHETGHTLGMEHDGLNNDCIKDRIKGSIMAPLVRSKFDRFYWSPCSRKELVQNYDRLWCLDDVPFDFNTTFMGKLAGQEYDRDEQCRMDFGGGFKACTAHTGDPCRQLWCDDFSYGSYCRTRRTPPLEGTSCGRNKWCRMGYCVVIKKDGSFEIPTPKPTPKPIHGNWSGWSPYGACSLTCGTGVRYRARACINPKPQHGGLPCQGSSYEINLCNTQKCIGLQPSFNQERDRQCRSRGATDDEKDWALHNIYKLSLDCDFETDLCDWTNSKDDHFEWTAYSGKTPSSGTGPSYDHTKGPDGKGTYLYIESSRPTDVGWRARLVSRLVAYHVTCFSFWYHAYGEDDHFGTLQLLLNTTGKEKVIWTISDSHGDKWRRKSITILSLMPYRIVIQGIRGDGYRSDIAIDDTTLRPGACDGDLKPPADENKIPMPPCMMYCESLSSGDVIKVVVKDGTRCYENPSIKDVCVKGRCQSVGCDGKLGSFKVYDNCGLCDGNNDTCTVNNGTISVKAEDDQEALFECPVGATNILVQDYSKSPNFFTVQIIGMVNETLLDGNASAPGIYEIAGTSFLYSRNDEVEKLLALGPLKEGVVVKARKKNITSNTPIFMKYEYYKPNKEPTVYVWKPVGWSECSVPCGGGMQKRIYDCYRKKDSMMVKYKLCYGVTRQKPWKRKCNTKICKASYFWRTYQWSQCSVTCSNGIQVRDVKCISSKYGEPNKTVSDSYCGEDKPLTTRNCIRDECLAMWKAGPWGECSKTCGRGLQTRTVECFDRDGKPSFLCTDESRMRSTKHCTLNDCVDDNPVVLGNLSCTFEAGYCRWRNSRDDQFDWQLHSEATLSRYTGPSYDHTFRSHKLKGKYIYCEASAPQNFNDRARLLSPTIHLSKLCLDFWYHMLGEKMGAINVYLETDAGLTRLWSRKGNQGGRWQNAMMQISSSTSYKIVLEGVRGPGYSSDMAIDDITVYRGRCPDSKYYRPECVEDRSRYCKLAVRFGWCSSSVWGNRLCCRSCSKTIARFAQQRMT